MNTSEFLKGYNEINRLIQENLEEIHQAYDVPNKYEFCHFFIERIDEVHIEFATECLGISFHEYQYDCVNMPLEWFESDEILKSHLAEIIADN